MRAKLGGPNHGAALIIYQRQMHFIKRLLVLQAGQGSKRSPRKRQVTGQTLTRFLLFLAHVAGPLGPFEGQGQQIRKWKK
jgi:hypothetical protein